MSHRRRLAFAGSPAFAATVLQALDDAGFPIARVYTQPDRPSGRGRTIRSSAVKRLATERGIPIRAPRSMRHSEEVSALSALDVDVLVVAAYGLLLPQSILDVPRNGCINVHASLLPRWRGAAPIERALIAGDVQTGVSIMRMDAGLDTGPVLRTATLPLPSYAVGDEVSRALASLGATTLIETLERLESIEPRPQPDHGATYAPKLSSVDSRLDFGEPAAALARRICALNSRQPAAALLDGERIRLLKAVPRAEPVGTAVPGTIVATTREGIDVACGGSTVLRVTELQLPGKKPVAADALVRGHGKSFAPGARWQSLPDAERR